MTAFPAITDDEFRLLNITEIHPIVKCDVEVFKFDLAEQKPEAGVKYYALSYAWGIEGNSASLFINGQAAAVTPSLYSGLCELYRREELRNEWHWIDQICIDQSNSDEKSIQVGAMHRIYSCAEATLVWLGPGNDETNMAIDGIPGLLEKMGKGTWPKDNDSQTRIKDRLPPKGHQSWQVIPKLFAYLWYSRVWVIQEVVLSQNAYVLCGDRTLTWESFAEFVDSCVRLWPALPIDESQDPGEDPFHDLFNCQQMNKYRGTHYRPLFGLLNCSRLRSTSNPIDHIYGIAAMISPRLRDLISINYGLGYVDATLQFGKVCIENDPCLKLLGLVRSTDRHPALLSWCPDFGFKGLHHISLTNFVGFQAGFTDVLSRRSEIRVLDDPKYALSVPGFRVDIVSDVIVREPWPRVGEDLHEAAALSWEHKCRHLFGKVREAYANKACSQESYARTLIASHWKPYRPVLPEDDIDETLSAVKRYWSERASGIPVDRRTYSVPMDLILQLVHAVDQQDDRSVFSTENGRIGLGPNCVKPGDIVCVFDSGACLYVLRYDENSSDKAAKFIGEAYVHDLMDLEVTLRDHTSEVGPREHFIIL